MPGRRSSRTLLVALTVAVAGEASRAPISGQETASEISVLFVGNSLTIWNDLPAMLESLLRSGGLERVRVASLSQPGFGLEDHWRGGIARAAIRTGEWDVIVLQQGPSATEGRPSLLEYSGRFAQEARDAGARVGLSMVWPTPARRNDFEGVSESYTMAADAADGLLFPVGDAWREAWCRNPDLALYGPDAFHPSPAATYLAALVIYGRLMRSDPRGLPSRLQLDSREVPPSTVDDETAALLQEAAAAANGNEASESCRG
ncbi:MAG: SGNH/GDSL hydrolase family protein [Gemmatimonadales bacterium]